jgi:hypothetical protein
VPAKVTVADAATVRKEADKKKPVGALTVPLPSCRDVRDRQPTERPLQAPRTEEVGVRVVEARVRFSTPPRVPVRVRGQATLAAAGSSSREPEDTLMEDSMPVDRGALCA